MVNNNTQRVNRLCRFASLLARQLYLYQKPLTIVHVVNSGAAQRAWFMIMTSNLMLLYVPVVERFPELWDYVRYSARFSRGAIFFSLYPYRLLCVVTEWVVFFCRCSQLRAHLFFSSFIFATDPCKNVHTMLYSWRAWWRKRRKRC